MKITVAICTWNRAAVLDRTLEGVRGLAIPAGIDWELVVVENNCTDGTRAVAARHAARLPLKLASEPVQGIAYARNRAVHASTGDLILFTDDDVLIDPGWLVAYVAAAARWPDASYFGGFMEPHFTVPPPPWVMQNVGFLHGLLGVRDLGPKEMPLPQADAPYGANMAFRRRAFDHSEFDVKLGRMGSDRLSGEETTFCRMIAAAGHLGVWVPAARIAHLTPPEYWQDDYLWTYFVGHGRTLARIGDRQATRQLKRSLLVSRLQRRILDVTARTLRRLGSRWWLPCFAIRATITGIRLQAAGDSH